MPHAIKPVRVVEESWGYSIGTWSVADLNTPLYQSLSGGGGFVLVALAAMFWVLPGAMMGQDLVQIKMVASVLLGAAGIFLLWYASTGTEIEIQIDLRKRALRKTLRNRKGQLRLVASHRFREFSRCRLYTDPKHPDQPTLLLFHDDMNAYIEVAQGDRDALEDLMERLQKDMGLCRNDRR